MYIWKQLIQGTHLKSHLVIVCFRITNDFRIVTLFWSSTVFVIKTKVISKKVVTSKKRRKIIHWEFLKFTSSLRQDWISSIPEIKLIYTFKELLKSSFNPRTFHVYLEILLSPSTNIFFHTSNKTKCQDLWHLCTEIKYSWYVCFKILLSQTELKSDFGQRELADPALNLQ